MSRCRACNRPIESLIWYAHLGTFEDLCRRCFSAAHSHAYDISPIAAEVMSGRLATSPKPKTKKARAA